ncbi:hypothetical protein NPIL_29551 [Nephila pilipes]|uniref:Uncharacterized protein n=1 Tax=Nephila pilipes TaxID=299642 RepID=A0A8X6QW34_NEPPI|nr:hypothetical protein NPIL_29551 [Nephila pilipes]
MEIFQVEKSLEQHPMPYGMSATMPITQDRTFRKITGVCVMQRTPKSFCKIESLKVWMLKLMILEDSPLLPQRPLRKHSDRGQCRPPPIKMSRDLPLFAGHLIPPSKFVANHISPNSNCRNRLTMGARGHKLNE